MVFPSLSVHPVLVRVLKSHDHPGIPNCSSSGSFAVRSWERAGGTEGLREQSLYKGVPHGGFHTPLPENSQSRQPETTAKEDSAECPCQSTAKAPSSSGGGSPGQREASVT